MGLFSALDAIFDDKKTGGGLSKQVVNMIDSFETKLDDTIAKAEAGAKKVDEVAATTVTSIQKAQAVIEKTAALTEKPKS